MIYLATFVQCNDRTNPVLGFDPLSLTAVRGIYDGGIVDKLVLNRAACCVPQSSRKNLLNCFVRVPNPVPIIVLTMVLTN